MTSSVIHSSDSSGRSSQIFLSGIEDLTYEENKGRTILDRVFGRAGRIRLPTGKALSRINLFRALVCVTFVTTFLCIAEFIWIRQYLQGLERFRNDDFDNTFYLYVEKLVPDSIWEEKYQSFIHNAMPLQIHSHNDYWRSVPLFEALASGCISVEADVHFEHSDLIVGHQKKPAHKGSTLRAMYLDPLEKMLEAQNTDVQDGDWRGIFNRAPKQTVVLLIDYKTSDPEAFDELHTQLQSLRDRDYLTYWNGTDRVMGPLTVVVTGKASFEHVLELNSTHRDIFWDAPLEDLLSGDVWVDDTVTYRYNTSNSYLASTPWKNLVMDRSSWLNGTQIVNKTAWEKDFYDNQVTQANTRGLVSRYWDVPSEPENLRVCAWRVLIKLGVGLLNMDDMGAVRERAQGWGRQIVSELK